VFVSFGAILTVALCIDLLFTTVHPVFARSNYISTSYSVKKFSPVIVARWLFQCTLENCDV
jgi:hypothetical protein